MGHFFDESFSLFNLISGIFIQWNLSKKVFSLFVKDTNLLKSSHKNLLTSSHKNYENYFFITQISYHKNFYSKKVTFLMLWKGVNDFIVFITPAVRRWCILIKKSGGFSNFFPPFYCLLIECRTSQITVVRKSLR